MTRALLLSLASLLVACGTRSDLIYRERIAPFSLGKADDLQPPRAGDARYRALWIDGAHVWVGGATNDYSPALAEAIDATNWNGFYFDPRFGLQETRRMWGASTNAIWATAGHTLLMFDGAAWLDDVDVPTDFTDVNGASTNDVWAVAEGVVVHRTASGWSALHPLSTSTKWSGVAADRSGGAFVVAPDAFAHVAADGSIDVGVVPDALVSPSIAATSTSDVWVVGNEPSGRAHVARGDGKSWVEIDPARATTLGVVRAVSRDDVWISGSATWSWNGDALREARCDNDQPLASDDLFVTAGEVWALGRCSATAEGADDVMRWTRQ